MSTEKPTAPPESADDRNADEYARKLAKLERGRRDSGLMRALALAWHELGRPPLG